MVGVDEDTGSVRPGAGGCQGAGYGAAFPSGRCATAVLVTATPATATPASATPVAAVALVSAPEGASLATCVLALVPASVVDGSVAATAPATVALAVVAVVKVAAAAIVDEISATGLEDAFSEGQNVAVGRSAVGHAAVPVSVVDVFE